MSNPWKAIVLFLFIFILIEVIKTDFREERIKTLEDRVESLERFNYGEVIKNYRESIK